MEVRGVSKDDFFIAPVLAVAATWDPTTLLVRVCQISYFPPCLYYYFCYLSPFSFFFIFSLPSFLLASLNLTSVLNKIAVQ